MLNRVTMAGRLAKDPELRTTTGGKSVVNFTIMVDRRFRNIAGSDNNADFFRVQAWDKTAEFVSSYLGKGRLVTVDGRLECRKYTDANGMMREVVEIIADSVESMDRPRDDHQGA